MKGGAHPSPLAALSFPNSKKVPIYCWVDREFSSRRTAKPSLELTLYGDFLHHNRAALTTRPRRLSQYVKRCSTDLTAPGSKPAGSGHLSIRKRGSITQPFIVNLPSSWCDNCCWKERKIASHPSIYGEPDLSATAQADLSIYSNGIFRMTPIINFCQHYIGLGLSFLYILSKFRKIIVIIESKCMMYSLLFTSWYFIFVDFSRRAQWS